MDLYYIYKHYVLYYVGLPHVTSHHLPSKLQCLPLSGEDHLVQCILFEMFQDVSSCLGKKGQAYYMDQSPWSQWMPAIWVYMRLKRSTITPPLYIHERMYIYHYVITNIYTDSDTDTSIIL